MSDRQIFARFCIVLFLATWLAVLCNPGNIDMYGFVQVKHTKLSNVFNYTFVGVEVVGPWPIQCYTDINYSNWFKQIMRHPINSVHISAQLSCNILKFVYGIDSKCVANFNQSEWLKPNDARNFKTSPKIKGVVLMTTRRLMV